MTILYNRWNNWIKTKGKEIPVGDGSKTFHYVMGNGMMMMKGGSRIQMTTLVRMKKKMGTLQIGIVVDIEALG